MGSPVTIGRFLNPSIKNLMMFVVKLFKQQKPDIFIFWMGPAVKR